MPRPKRPSRLDAIVVAATAAFAEHGFDRANVQAIASSANVSTGSIYQYAADKDALFELAALRALESPAAAFPSLPYARTPAGNRQRLIDDCLHQVANFPQLWVGAQRREHDGSIGEFVGILLEMATWFVRYRSAIVLAERNRSAWPELADGFDRIVWADLTRRLVAYVGPRMRSGALVASADPALVARFTLDALLASLVIRPIGLRATGRAADLEVLVRLIGSSVVGSG